MSTQVGVENLHIALMTTEDTKTTQAVYGTPQFVSQSISIGFKPETKNAVLYADDGAAEAASANGSVKVDVNTKDLPLPIRAALLGSSYEGGVLTHKNTDVPPYLAMMFKSVMANGKYRYVLLTKGKAVQPEEDYKTKTDSPEFNTPKIAFEFIRRVYDDIDYLLLDEPAFTGGSTFFNSVYAPSAPAALTCTTSPADGATGVLVGADIVLTFSTAVNPDTVNSGNIMVTKSDGTAVAGALTLGTNNTVVTFNPTENLANDGVYIAIATTNVKGANGSVMAENKVINFTVAGA